MSKTHDIYSGNDCGFQAMVNLKELTTAISGTVRFGESWAGGLESGEEKKGRVDH